MTTSYPRELSELPQGALDRALLCGLGEPEGPYEPRPTLWSACPPWGIATLLSQFLARRACVCVSSKIPSSSAHAAPCRDVSGRTGQSLRRPPGPYRQSGLRFRRHSLAALVRGGRRRPGIIGVSADAGLPIPRPSPPGYPRLRSRPMHVQNSGLFTTSSHLAVSFAPFSRMNPPESAILDGTQA
jgi:hypothetical protein